MSVDLRQLFDDLVRFETDLWNGVDARLRQAGAVSLGSLEVLRVVGRTPACRVNDIADALSITIGGASQAVDRLAARELCARRPNPGDRRSSIVELTPAGAEALATAQAVFDADLLVWFGPAAPGSALRNLARTLSTLRTAGVARRRAPGQSKPDAKSTPEAQSKPGGDHA
ncbi:MarR family winged helix-turn-helix transcriptional regulator [Dactylosporangium sp. CA-092794]|uniref:MarR family winged helix-turn-helix transcriptional regulator n=1 Tax=Dactylosporangium sp. CA-092794 TaxID=3239929 RepID=UPI003D935C83